MNAPPTGYLRGRDVHDRYLIVPGPDAAHVRTAYRLAAETQRSMESIRLELRQVGFACSKMQMTRLLRSPVYAGRILIPAWGGDDEVEVDGIHEPLVEMAVWERVQRERFGRVDCRSVQRRRYVPELPLRGHLLCPTSGARLTGSRSKSRNGSHVWYYHGQGSGAYRLPAERAHDAFAEHLRSVRLAAPVANRLRAVADERGAAGETARRRAVGEARKVLDVAEEKLLAIDTRYLDGDIDRESRDRLLAHYRTARDTARGRILDAETEAGEGPEHLRYAVAVLERLPEVWASTSPEARDALAGSIWPSGLTFDGERYRTAPGDGTIALLGGVRAENGDAPTSEKGGRLVWRPGRDLNSRPPP